MHSGLEKHSQVFCKLLTHLNNTYTKDNAECLPVLSSTIEFLRLLLTQSTDDDGGFGRTYTLGIHELRNVVCWGVGDEQHPLYDLEKVLEVKLESIYRFSKKYCFDEKILFLLFTI